MCSLYSDIPLSICFEFNIDTSDAITCIYSLGELSARAKSNNLVLFPITNASGKGF